MVSSAIYRYFPSRDDLLTALIIDAYDALGDAVEAADAAVDRADLRGRWLAVCRAARAWALAHPAEYALIYGSPVPGYAAPDDTVGAGPAPARSRCRHPARRAGRRPARPARRRPARAAARRPGRARRADLPRTCRRRCWPAAWPAGPSCSG